MVTILLILLYALPILESYFAMTGEYEDQDEGETMDEIPPEAIVMLLAWPIVIAMEVAERVSHSYIIPTYQRLGKNVNDKRNKGKQ